MDFSLRALRYLVAVAEAGNVTEAARRLHVSQSALSAAVAEIEARAGVAVFVRHHARGVSLTPAGERVVTEARLLLRHAEDFSRSARSLSDAVQGEIAVGCFLILAPRFLPVLLSAFRARHPGVAIALSEGDQEEIIAGLIEGRTEMALAYDFAVPDEIEATPLLDLPPVAIVAEGHAFAQREEVSLAELAAEPLVLLDLPHSRDYFLNLFRREGLEPRIGHRSRSYEFVRSLVGNGYGYSVHNAVPVPMQAYDGSRIAAIPIGGRPTPVRVMSLRLKRQPLRPAVNAFARFVEESFGDGRLFGTSSSPLAGEVSAKPTEGGGAGGTAAAFSGTTPTPDPSPQGGGEDRR